MNFQVNHRRPREYEKMYVINNHEKQTAVQMAAILNLSTQWVVAFCKHMKLGVVEPDKFIPFIKRERRIKPVKDGFWEAPDKKIPIIRPPSTYTNIRTPYGIATELHSH